MTKLTFEIASFADSIKKAAILAPTTGQAFDKAAGIVLDIDPSGASGWNVLVRTTNTDIYRMEWVNPESSEGDKCSWRLPSILFNKVVSSLSIGASKTLTLEENVSGLQRYVRLKSGRTTARFNLMDDGYYPTWEIFDPTSLTETIDLGGRITQVEWAAAKGEAPFSGVHLDGQLAMSTDRYKLVCAPLVIPGLTEPITIPAGLLSQLLKQTGEVRVGVADGQFLVMPDDQTQLRCITYGEKYPSTQGLRSRVGTHQLKIKKAALLGILERAASYGSSDRDAALRCFLGEEEFAVMIANQELGTLGDALEVPGQCQHERCEIRFSATNLIEAIVQAPNDELTLGYFLSNKKASFHIDGGSGYLAWVQPRADLKKEGS